MSYKVIAHDLVDVDVILNKQETTPPVSIANINLVLKEIYRWSIDQEELKRAHEEEKHNGNRWYVAHITIDINFQQVKFLAEHLKLRKRKTEEILG